MSAGWLVPGCCDSVLPVHAVWSKPSLVPCYSVVPTSSGFLRVGSKPAVMTAMTPMTLQPREQHATESEARPGRVKSATFHRAKHTRQLAEAARIPSPPTNCSRHSWSPPSPRCRPPRSPRYWRPGTPERNRSAARAPAWPASTRSSQSLSHCTRSTGSWTRPLGPAMHRQAQRTNPNDCTSSHPPARPKTASTQYKQAWLKEGRKTSKPHEGKQAEPGYTRKARTQRHTVSSVLMLHFGASLA